MGDWLNQVLAYALLDRSDALGVDTVAVYLGWQALLIAESLARVLAAATPGPTPSLNALRADFRTAMQADIGESFAVRMRKRYPPFVTPARNQAASLEVRCGLSARAFKGLSNSWTTSFGSCTGLRRLGGRRWAGFHLSNPPTRPGCGVHPGARGPRRRQ